MRNAHGRMTKKYIKYDEANMFLILELRLPGDLSWIKITPTQARDLTGAADLEDIERNRKKLTARRVLQPSRQPPTASPNFEPVGHSRGFGGNRISRPTDSSDSDSSLRNTFDIRITPIVRQDNGYGSTSDWSEDQWQGRNMNQCSVPLGTAHEDFNHQRQPTKQKQTWTPRAR